MCQSRVPSAISAKGNGARAAFDLSRALKAAASQAATATPTPHGSQQQCVAQPVSLYTRCCLRAAALGMGHVHYRAYLTLQSGWLAQRHSRKRRVLLGIRRQTLRAQHRNSRSPCLLAAAPAGARL